MTEVSSASPAIITTHNGYDLIYEDGEMGILCLDCSKESFLKNDVEKKFCGYCNKPHGFQPPRAELKAEAQRLRHQENQSYYQIAATMGISKSTAERYSNDTTPEVIYPDYKEPLWAVEVGHGYYGTMGHSIDGRFVQCHECGGMYANLGQHASKAHGLNPKAYRDKYQLMAKTSLISHAMRKVYAGTYQYLWTQEHKDHIREQLKKREKRGFVRGNQGKLALEAKNKRGICPDQLIDKIQRLARVLGSAPSYQAFEKEYGYAAMDATKREHGSYTNAVYKAGFTPAGEARTYDRLWLLLKLRSFREKYGRDALTNDLNNSSSLPSISIYQYAFGSLREARKLSYKLNSE